MKTYLVTVNFAIQEVKVKAKNKKEAKVNALWVLNKRSLNKLIHKTYPDNKLDIGVDEIQI